MARSTSPAADQSSPKTRRPARSELKNTAYEIFIGALSILSIINLVLVYAIPNDGALELVLSVMNGLFSVIFLGDFIYRISTAPSAARYFFRGFGWADLLASLPFPQLKILRLFRLLRVFRLLRELGPRTVWRTLVHDRANSALMTLLLMGVLVLQFGSISILAVEQNADGANITSASDAIWYTIVTISTVGYGDQYPVTNAGRLIGAGIIVVGVGIFGTFTGYLANLFLGPSKAPEPAPETTDAAAPAPAATATTSDEGSSTHARHHRRHVTDATSKGVAAGAVSGAVKKGASAGSGEGSAVEAGVPVAASEADPAALAGPDDTAERVRVLLAQSEQAMAEVRRLLAGSPS